tara:strand:- start:212 stop:493 length:282 start_codon:yes stop_codon:yes gene_type:complete
MESPAFWKSFLTVFATVFFAEIGDKTQLATMLYATDAQVNRWLVFLAASLALVTAAGMAVLVGQQVAQYIPVEWLKRAAGAAFIVIGVWTIFG